MDIIKILNKEKTSPNKKKFLNINIVQKPRNSLEVPSFKNQFSFKSKKISTSKKGLEKKSYQKEL